MNKELDRLIGKILGTLTFSLITIATAYMIWQIFIR